jgi:hypothetical protein
VGIFASGAALFSASEDRESAERLARQALVYDRRSEAYIDTLRALQELSTNARLRKYQLIPLGWLEFQAQQAPLRARMTAFGSRQARRLYTTMYFAASRFVAAALARDIQHRSPTVQQRFWLMSIDRRQFDEALREFEGVVNREVG